MKACSKFEQQTIQLIALLLSNAKPSSEKTKRAIRHVIMIQLMLFVMYKLKLFCSLNIFSANFQMLYWEESTQNNPKTCGITEHPGHMLHSQTLLF